MIKVAAVIPFYNHPLTIGAMVAAVRAHGLHVVVVDDGSAQPCAAVLDQVCADHAGALTLVRLARNGGKGGAVVAGLRAMIALGFTHALQIDADGQHDVGAIPAFLQQSVAAPNAVIYGYPCYDQSVPRLRWLARYLTHVWVWINTCSLSIRDSMCGFRIYPLAAVAPILAAERLGQRMDFDPEILVRLYWDGAPMLGVPTKVVYPDDGVSHFRLLLDNLLLARMHARLFAGMLRRLPRLLGRQRRP